MMVGPITTRAFLIRQLPTLRVYETIPPPVATSAGKVTYKYVLLIRSAVRGTIAIIFWLNPVDPWKVT